MQGADPDQATTVDSSGCGTAIDTSMRGPEGVGNGSRALRDDGTTEGVSLTVSVARAAMQL